MKEKQKLIDKFTETQTMRARRCLEYMHRKDNKSVYRVLKIQQPNRSSYITGSKKLSLSKAMVIIETCKELYGYDGKEN